MSTGAVISLFDYTGNMLRPWADAGYQCLAFDIQHGPTPYATTVDGITYVGGNLKDGALLPAGMAVPENIAMVFAFPPCDHLAVSGARWFKGKGLRKLAEAIELFAVAAEICEDSDAPYMIENPVSTISTYWRKPDYTFHPWQYTGYCAEDNYTKKTCLWAGGGFVMPPWLIDDSLPPPDDRIHKAGPGDGRKNFRSATPMGFAKAVYEANKERVV